VKRILLHEAAEEISAAEDYYSNVEPGFGREIILELVTAYGHIDQFSFAWPVTFCDNRHHQLTRFPLRWSLSRRPSTT